MRIFFHLVLLSPVSSQNTVTFQIKGIRESFVVKLRRREICVFSEYFGFEFLELVYNKYTYNILLYSIVSPIPICIA